MMRYYFNPEQQRWLLKCGLCLEWVCVVYETREMDLCQRCLNRPDHQEGRAA